MRFSYPAPAVSGLTETWVPATYTGGYWQAVLGAPPAGTVWLLSRVVVVLRGAGYPAAYLYAGAQTDADLLDGTYAGQLDEAEYTTNGGDGLLIPASTAVSVAWPSVTTNAGQSGGARFEYTVRAA